MIINKYFGIDGAKQSSGVTVIIDIFRAATVSAFLLDKGIRNILPVSTKEEAFKYKETHPGVILVGEEHGIKIKGFDLGNSPFEISKSNNLSNKCAVHRSSMGTQGIVNATNATEIIFGSFCTSTAISDYLTKESPSTVSIVAMDGEDSEDEVYANYLIAKLKGEKPKPISDVIKLLKNHPGAARFLDPNNKEFPKEDFYLCLELDKFNFFPILKKGFIVKKNA